MSVAASWRRWTLSAVALFTATSPFLADWNETHIYNPSWTGHAKFHNAQTMTFGLLLGLSALAVLWLLPRGNRQNLISGAYLAAIYWAAQLPAILFPGTAFVDPEFAHYVPRVFGVEILQVHLAVVLVALCAAAAFWPEKPGRTVSHVAT